MDTTALDKIWESTLKKLSHTYSSVIMDLFFKNTQLIYLDEKTAVIQNHNDNYRNSLASSYTEEVSRYISEVVGREVRVYFESAEKKPVDLEKYKKAAREEASADEPDFVDPDSDRYGNFFDARYTFDNFIVGSSNTFAHAACSAVAREGVEAGYNPLYIYGDSGLGKTHLLYAIINETLKRNPHAKIVYVKGEEFMNEIIDAIHDTSTARFREKYRKADILLVDDIQFIAGKTATQNEFFHTFNTLYEDNKQIVLTSDCPARDINPLDERLRSRFEWGIIGDIQPPDYELRIAIMKDKAKTYHAAFPQEVFQFLAEHLKSNVRQMEGAIKKIAAKSFLNNIPVTVELAMECISDIISSTEPDSVIVDRVISAVSKKYGIPDSQIRGKGRTKDIARARNIAIYVIRAITDMSFPKLGNEFGRNHTTMMHSCEVVEKDMKNNNLLELEIKDLIKEIKE